MKKGIYRFLEYSALTLKAGIISVWLTLAVRTNTSSSMVSLSKGAKGHLGDYIIDSLVGTYALEDFQPRPYLPKGGRPLALLKPLLQGEWEKLTM